MIRIVFLCAALFPVVTGCRTMAPLPAIDLADPGWTLRQGQAAWQSGRDAPEIAGELLLATNPDGRALLQFTKTPLPLVTVQTRDELWQIEFTPQQRRFSGKGTPAPRLSWVHLARALSGVSLDEMPRTHASEAAAGHRSALREGGSHVPLPAPLRFRFTEEHSWALENRDTGESISGFLNP